MQPMMLLLMMATPTQDALTAMERATGAEYLRARARMIEQGSTAELEALRRESRYDAATWKREVIADAAHFWLTRRADAEHACALEGLQPATYLKRRRPEPEAARELVRLDAAPILFELLLKTNDQVALRNDRERAAFEDALVIALGASSHPAAQPALLEIARSDRWRAPLRKLAAKQVRDERELTAMLSDPLLAAGAVQGLGQVRTRGAVATLIAAAKQPDLRLAAIRALGSAASPTVLLRSGDPDAPAIRAEASHALIEMLRAPDAAVVGDALVETIGLIADPSARSELAQLEVNRELALRALRRLDRQR